MSAKKFPVEEKEVDEPIVEMERLPFDIEEEKEPVLLEPKPYPSKEKDVPVVVSGVMGSGGTQRI